MVQLTLILDNIRSAHNVGAILRTCDAAGVKQLLTCGITPYPRLQNDARDPVVSARHNREIAKTALGAEQTILIEHFDDTKVAIAKMRAEGRTIYGLEQTANATSLFKIKPLWPSALIMGSEVYGVSASVLRECDGVLHIPQVGTKESLNVAVAAGIAIYQLLRFK